MFNIQEDIYVRSCDLWVLTSTKWEIFYLAWCKLSNKFWMKVKVNLNTVFLWVWTIFRYWLAGVQARVTLWSTPFFIFTLLFWFRTNYSASIQVLLPTSPRGAAAFLAGGINQGGCNIPSAHGTFFWISTAGIWQITSDLGRYSRVCDWCCC